MNCRWVFVSSAIAVFVATLKSLLGVATVQDFEIAVVAVSVVVTMKARVLWPGAT